MALTIDDRLIEAESRLMHMERVVEQLNATIVEQATELLRLARDVKSLKDDAGAPGESD